MAQIKAIQLPPGWTGRSGGPMADITRLGPPGRRHLQTNDPWFIWTFGVDYKRSDFEENTELRFEDVYAFFLVTMGYGFEVDDVADNHSAQNRGSGVVLPYDGAYRLFKRYSIFEEAYDHPVTRPKTDLVLSEGAWDAETATVTGISDFDPDNPPTWTGGFFRPMIFSENGLMDKRTPDGLITAFAVNLEENFEL